MLIKRTELLNVLDSVQPGLANKEIIEQSQSFILRDGTVSTFNDEMYVTGPLDLEGITGAVKAEEFHDLLKKMKDEEIDLSISEKGGEMIIQGKKTRAGIRLEEKITLPLDDVPKAKNWKKLPEDFCQAIRFSLFSVSNDMSKPKMTSLHLSGNTVTSCDNYRATQVTLSAKESLFEEGMMLPSKAAREIIKFEPSEYGVFPGWIFFKMPGNVTFACRTLQGKYPDLTELMKVTGAKLTLPKSTASMLERAMIFTKGTLPLDASVQIIIEEGKIRIKGSGEAGWVKEKTKLDYTGPEISFIINPKFLMDIVDLLKVVTVGENRLKMEGKNFTHLVQLMAMARPGKK